MLQAKKTIILDCKKEVIELSKYISIEEKFARNIVSHFIQQELSAKEEKILVYGWSILLINCMKIFVIGIIAVVLGIFLETMTMFVAYTLLRMYAYGFHAKSSLNCTWISIVTFNILPFLIIQGLEVVKLSNSIFHLVLYFVFLVDAILIYKYCPSPTQRREKWKNKDRTKKKYQALGMLMALAIVSYFIDSQVYASMVLFGITMAVVFITPIFIKNKQ